MRKQIVSANALIGLITAVLFMISAGSASAQIRDYKTGRTIEEMTKRILKDKVSMELTGDSGESLYVFEVGPGKTTVKISLTARNDNAGANIFFTDKDDNEVAPFVVAQAIKSQGETVETVTIESRKKMLVYMKIAEIEYGTRGRYAGDLEIRFTGSFVGLTKSRF